MNRTVVSILFLIVSMLAQFLPKPINVVISLSILVPLVIYIIVDIIKNGNKWKD